MGRKMWWIVIGIDFFSPNELISLSPENVPEQTIIWRTCVVKKINARFPLSVF